MGRGGAMDGAHEGAGQRRGGASARADRVRNLWDRRPTNASTATDWRKEPSPHVRRRTRRAPLLHARPAAPPDRACPRGATPPQSRAVPPRAAVCLPPSPSCPRATAGLRPRLPPPATPSAWLAMPAMPAASCITTRPEAEWRFGLRGPVCVRESDLAIFQQRKRQGADVRGAGSWRGGRGKDGGQREDARGARAHPRQPREAHLGGAGAPRTSGPPMRVLLRARWCLLRGLCGRARRAR